MEAAAPDSKCRTCARWSLYTYVLDRKKQEGWRCLNGVIEAGTRIECSAYLREVGAEEW